MELCETLTKENAMPKKVTKKSVTKKSAAAKKSGATKKGSAVRAGRPKGSGRFGCETKAVRIPAFLEEDVKNFCLRKIKAGK